MPCRPCVHAAAHHLHATLPRLCRNTALSPRPACWPGPRCFAHTGATPSIARAAVAGRLPRELLTVVDPLITPFIDPFVGKRCLLPPDAADAGAVADPAPCRGWESALCREG
jgi:hypothetical protein